LWIDFGDSLARFEEDEKFCPICEGGCKKVAHTNAAIKEWQKNQVDPLEEKIRRIVREEITKYHNQQRRPFR
jgi:hypothetical protein